MQFEELTGKRLTSIKHTDDAVFMDLDDGRKFQLHHHQDCCESVYLEDVCGSLDDLVDTVILSAEEVSNFEDPPLPEGETNYSCTWTFYKMSTIRGSATFRFFGTSNGYYSESVNFDEIK